MRVVAKLCGVGLLLTGLGCAGSFDGGEDLDYAEAIPVPGLDVREGGLTETLPWNGESRTESIVVAARRERPRNLIVSNRIILWTEHPAGGSAAVVVLDKATGELRYLSTEGSLPWSIGYDGREAFWADPIDSTMWSVDPEVRIPVKLGAPDGAALVAADARGPVWANIDGTVWARDPETNLIDRLASGPGVPQGLILDAERVYWISGTAGRLLSVSRDGGAVKELAEVGSDVTQLGFTGDSVSWLDPAKGQVLSVPRVGGAVDELAAGLGDAVSAAFDAGSVWVLAGVQGSQLLRVPLDGTPVRSHARGVGLVTELASDARFVYAIDGESGSILAFRR